MFRLALVAALAFCALPAQAEVEIPVNGVMLKHRCAADASDFDKGACYGFVEAVAARCENPQEAAALTTQYFFDGDFEREMPQRGFLVMRGDMLVRVIMADKGFCRMVASN